LRNFFDIDVRNGSIKAPINGVNTMKHKITLAFMNFEIKYEWAKVNKNSN
jgi:hypothetical protein